MTGSRQSAVDDARPGDEAGSAAPDDAHVNVDVNVNVDGRSQEISRREALGMLAAFPAVAALPGTMVPPWVDRAARAARDALLAGDFSPEFFTAAEWRTVRLLVDLVIPRDARSGSASDAGVPEFMDFTMADRPNQQSWMREGLAWLDGESERRHGVVFVDATAAQRTGILDEIAWPDRAPDGMEDGVRFFNRFRDMTASGFYSSRVGVADLGYQGNTYLTAWNGCPPEARRHLGVE